MDLNKSIRFIRKDVVLLYEKMFPLYLITGEKNFLIDCSISPYSEKIVKNVKKILNESSLTGVLLTHSHYDHTGACPMISSQLKPKIFGSPRTVELLQKKKVLKYIENLNREFEDLLGIGPNLKFSGFNTLKSVKEGDKISVEKDKYFQVFETPGHTKCSLSYLLEPYGVLFPGDAAGVIERRGKIKPLFLSNFSSYLISLKKLIKLKAEILALPHNRFISGKDNVKTFLSKSLEQSERIGHLIQKEISSGKNLKTIAKNILADEFAEPTVQGPKKAFTINLNAMVNAVKKEMN